MLPNDVTGFPTEDEKIEQDLKKAQEDIKMGEILREMTESRGWKVLTVFLKEKVESLMEQLVVEKDPETIRTIQNLVLALRWLPTSVDNLFLDSERAENVLLSFQEYIGQARENG